jgi:hypothetical protein
MLATLPKEKPRRKSARTLVHGCIDSDTPILDDQRLYQWAGGEPPRNFCVHKTIFRNRTPSEIAGNGWYVLRPAVSELAEHCGREVVATKIDWLKLDTVLEQQCNVGVYGDEIVTAAGPAKTGRNPFIPFRFFERFEKNKDWKNKAYWSSYRHFSVRFDIGLSFFTDRHQLLCDVSYLAHFGIHRFCSLFALIHIDGTTLVAPVRQVFSETLCDLPGKIEWISRQCQEFIARTGASWIAEHDPDLIYQNEILRRVQPCHLPDYAVQSLKKERALSRCLTNLDLLLYLSKHFNLDPERYAVPLLTLSKLFKKG